MPVYHRKPPRNGKAEKEENKKGKIHRVPENKSNEKTETFKIIIIL